MRSNAPELRLRPPEPSDEQAIRALHTQIAPEGFHFLLFEGTWDEILAAIKRESEGTDLPPGRARADYLVAEAGGVLVGRVSIRYELNAFLHHEGGHVGYAVGPEFRERGYATEILRRSLERLAAAGVPRALVIHNDGNSASSAVIRACGGELEDVRRGRDGLLKHRYWIATSTSGVH